MESFLSGVSNKHKPSYRRYAVFMVILLWLAMSTVACVRNQPEIVIITATFPPDNQQNAPIVASPVSSQNSTPIAPSIVQPPNVNLSPMPAVMAQTPTPNTVASLPEIPESYTVKAGDTLSLIAQRYGVSMQAILDNNTIANPNILQVGQVLNLPDFPQVQTPSFKIIADSRLVRASKFDIGAFIAQMPGFIRSYSEDVGTRLANGSTRIDTLTSAQIVERVALEYSVDPRLLLTILEYRAQWLSQINIPATQQIYPLANLTNREGLYRQLAWLANELNRGYYGWKYRGLNSIELADGTRYTFNLTLNPATIALQYVFSLFNTHQAWLNDVQETGFFATYFAYFGNPFDNALDQPLPNSLAQPPLTLPFAEGERWYFTGGSHGGWGSGSAWAAVDFAPPDERTSEMGLCYTSEYWTRAVASGVIARSGDGVVVLDLDGDGDEATGWSILYLHLDESVLIPQGQSVMVGTPLGRAACSGGFSTATHIHIARRFNGEWLPAQCADCPSEESPPPFVMSDWQVITLSGQEYQGYLVRNGEQRQAEQGRDNPINQVSR
jgi:LasA protease